MLRYSWPSLRVPAVVAASTVLALQACAAGDGWSFDEVARVPDPGGRVEGVLAEENGGATTSLGYRVFVVPRGQGIRRESRDAVATLYGATRGGNAYGANLRWAAPGELVVEFASARRDSVLRPAVRVAGVPVRVALRRGVVDAAAPPGSMRSNRAPSAP